jgi:hypothetical protein
MPSLMNSGASFEELTRRVKERARRERLHREIGALRTKHEKVTTQQRFNWRERSWRLMSKIKRLEGDLRQPELFL